MNDFAAWYEIYPRKVSRKDAEKAWNQLTPEQRFAAFESLPVHVRYWQVAGTSPEYLPYPASWLRGERWTDELEMPQEADEWWKSQTGIHRKALSLGLSPKAGEGWHELKARVLAKLKAA